MEDNFILIGKNCPNCRLVLEKTAEKCPKCEGELDNVVTKYDRC
jgi:RNA polymerase subunit RPABC4/transcription elongation factor Spt4